MKSDTRSRNLLFSVGVAIALLVATALVIALRPARQFDPTTPEGTVQSYVQAVLDDEAAKAASYLDPDLAARCDLSHLESHSDSTRAVIVDTDVEGDRARIEIRFTEVSGEVPFDRHEHIFDEVFVLERHTDGWRIAERPWPFYFCPEVTS